MHSSLSVDHYIQLQINSFVLSLNNNEWHGGIKKDFLVTLFRENGLISRSLKVIVNPAF